MNASAKVGGVAPATWLRDTQAVYGLARGLKPLSDKFTTHGYQVMYGTFLEPLSRAGSNMKMLEIGLGCNMNYGPGASVKLWKALLPNANTWFAEFNGTCVKSQRALGKLDGINTVVGDQGNAAHVSRWIQETGGQFDVIVDDGGHHNVQIMTSFLGLWPQVKPGGLYFIEDLQVGRAKAYSNKGPDDAVVVSDVIQDWVEQLAIQPSDVRASSRHHPLPADTAFVFCQREACVVGKSAGATGGAPTQWPEWVGAVRELGISLQPVPDKFTIHSYQTMYGMFLQPIREAAVPIKMLEIGLGCGMAYGPGASVALWKKLLPQASLWFAEYNSKCVQSSRARGLLKGINVVVGDQGDEATVRRWAQETGGQFDVIVDDGGHHNVQIMTSFHVLWPQVRPGGLYFIEDLQVGRSRAYSSINAKDSVAVADVIQSWIEQLTIQRQDWKQSSLKHPLPQGVAFICCQREACVVGKAQQ